MAQVIKIDKGQVSLQAFSGTKGFSTRSSVQFLDRPMQVTYSSYILGRVFSGTGKPMDGGPELADDPKIASVVLL